MNNNEHIVKVKPIDLISAQFPDEIQSEIRFKVSSFYKGKSVGRGLDREEERRFLPAIIGIDSSSPDWERETKEFWANYSVTIPRTGLELNISKDKSGVPVNIDDYMTFRFVSANPKVASTESDLLNKESFKAYIQDYGKLKMEESKQFNLKKKANKLYFTLISNPDQAKMYWVLELLREKGTKISENLPEEEAQLMLDGIKDKNYVKFIETVEDQDLDLKFFISKCIEHTVLTKEGNTYFYDDLLLGVEKETIGYLKNPKNSATFMKIKSKLSTTAEHKHILSASSKNKAATLKEKAATLKEEDTNLKEEDTDPAGAGKEETPLDKK